MRDLEIIATKIIRILPSKQITSSAKLVYIALLFSEKKISLHQLAQRCGLSGRSVHQSISMLEYFGFIKKHIPSRRQGAEYTIL